MKKLGNLEAALNGTFVPRERVESEESTWDEAPEDKLDLVELFGAVGWETRGGTDEEWGAAPPVPPLYDPAKQMTWNGPTLFDAPPEPTRFDAVFDEDQLNEVLARKPEFEARIGRFNPFEIDRLRSLVDDDGYSTFLSRPIITFKDALDHSIQLCLFWAEEDEQFAVAKQVELSKPDVKVESEELDAEIEAAKAEWKLAVATRDETKAQLDAIVVEKRLKYQQLKKLKS